MKHEIACGLALKRLGADEDKATFEAKLKKIAEAWPKPSKGPKTR